MNNSGLSIISFCSNYPDCGCQSEIVQISDQVLARGENTNGLSVLELITPLIKEEKGVDILRAMINALKRGITLEDFPDLEFWV